MKTKMYISCILALMITAAAWAAEGPTSPTKAATAELNGTQADQFMSLTGWSDVKFDKLFTYAGFAQQNSSTVDLGAAFKAGPVYIGAWYQGQFGQVNNLNEKKVTTTVTESPVLPGTIDNINRKNEPKVSKTHAAVHNVAVLLGFGNIGVRLGYARKGENKSGTYFGDTIKNDTIVTNSKTPDQITGKTTYDPNGYINGAERVAAVDFGMNLGVKSFSLSPSFGLSFNVKQDSKYGVETNVTTQNTSLGTHNIQTTVNGENKTKTTLNAKLGADLGLNDSLHSTFSFGYAFGIDIYGTKKHKAADGSTKELANEYTGLTDTRSDIETGASRTVADIFMANTKNKSNITNTITVGYALQKDFTERLSFFAGVEAPIGFNFEKTVTKTVNEQKTVMTDKVNKLNNSTKTTIKTSPTTTENTTTVTFNPVVRAALSYAAIPNKVFVSFGTEVKPFGQKVNNVEGYQHQTTKTTVDRFTQTTEEVTEYPNDAARNIRSSTTTAVAQKESQKKTVTYGKAAVDVKLGVRWNIVDAVSLDVLYNKSLLQIINWYNIGELKLACTIKF